MAWNPQKKPPKGLPDLEAELKKFFKNLLFSQSPKHASNPNKVQHKAWQTWVISAIVAVSIWAVSGIYQVETGQQALVIHFGKVQTDIQPGWHWFARFFEQKYVFDNTQPFSINLRESLVSKDQAVFSANFTMQYQVKNAKQYVMTAANMNATLQQIVESQLAQNVGQITLGQLLGDNSKLDITLQQQIQQVCDRYNLGITIGTVRIDNIQVPDAVKAVIESLQNAAQANVNMQQQAKTQAAEDLQSAQSNAAQIISQAQAQAAQAVPKAQQEVAEFLAILPAYQQNPQATKAQLYYKTMQTIYSNAKVIVADSANSVKLPAEIIQDSRAAMPITPASATTAPIADDKAKLAAYVRWKEAQRSES